MRPPHPAAWAQSVTPLPRQTVQLLGGLRRAAAARESKQGLSNAVLLDVDTAAHEVLPVPAVQDVVVDFLRGADVHGRRMTTSLPHFATIAEALQASPQRGR